MRSVTITVLLDDGDTQVLAAAVRQMNERFCAWAGTPDPPVVWDELTELRALLRSALYEERRRQQRAAERRTELASIGLTPADMQPLAQSDVPEWLQNLG